MSQKISTECVYRSIACNRGTGTADLHFNTDSLVFGGGFSGLVLSRSTSEFSVTNFLPLSSIVTSAVWMKQEPREVAIICENNGKVTLWDLEQCSTLVVCEHLESVISVSAIAHRGEYYIASCASDSSIKICCTVNNVVRELGTITIPRQGFALCCTMFTLRESLVMALGTDTSSILLYLVDDSPTLLTSLIGHEDWVRGLDFRGALDSRCGGTLASGSQDHYIRLWNISRDEREGKEQFKLKEKVFELEGVAHRVTVESILLGHDNWVTSVRWMSNGMLLTASMDKTLIIWSQGSDGMWSENAHVGEVGGNNMGLLGALPTSDSTIIISHSFQGAFQGWTNTLTDGWTGIPMPGGHFNSVKDLCWAPSGSYLLTASTDQSVRVSAEWTRGRGWYEIARSQIHGHDMACVHCITDSQYLSGSEEKVLRVFQATSTFFSNLTAISGRKVEGGEGERGVIGAHIPALGLSNKAITSEDMANTVVAHEGTASIKDCDIPYQVAFAPADLTTPPVEEILLQNTLWPEIHKLYGHGYEVYQCTSSPDSRLLATSCKAAQQQFAVVMLWRVGTWTKVAELSHHKLTVTRMKFSKDSRYLLSVSRDRDWAVWDVSETALTPPSTTLTPLATSPPRAHSRIIWDCAWYHGNSTFCTVSRDKKLVVWDSVSGSKPQWIASSSITFDTSVTAVDISMDGLILVGFDSGDLKICTRTTANSIELIHEIPRHQCATQTINTVQWRPAPCNKGGDGAENGGDVGRQFAACSDDGNVLIINTYCLNES